jgi:hypothetical protein
MRTALFAAALALPLAAAAQTTPEYQPTGEINFRAGGIATGASYDEARVIGPSVNMQESEGGSWIGDIGGGNVDLEISDDKVNGVGVDLHVKQEKNRVTIRGNVFNRRVSMEVDDKKVSGRAGECSIDLQRQSPGLFVGNIGCSRGTQTPQIARAEMRFTGTAAEKNPPHPQFALALVSVLPL